MSTVAAPAPTLAPAGPGDRSASTHRPGSAGRPVDGSEPRPSGFRAAVVLAVLLTVPAVHLVGKGELSAHDALVRFGCAWAFAAGGVALVLSTVGSRSATIGDGDRADDGAAQPGGPGAAPEADAAAYQQRLNDLDDPDGPHPG